MLIEQSLATQYGLLPTAQADLPWCEWCKLVSGLMDDTPLGRVVAVRAETDREAVRRFSPWQRRVRAEWKRFLAHRAAARADPKTLRQQMAGLERMLARAFGPGG